MKHGAIAALKIKQTQIYVTEMALLEIMNDHYNRHSEKPSERFIAEQTVYCCQQKTTGRITPEV